MDSNQPETAPSASERTRSRMPTVSVVIATYNCAQYLSQAVESVLAQTYDDYELIVVNDGSRDSTDSVMLPYLDRENVRYYKKQNGGQASAKNYGIRQAAGRYIAFLDADDWWDATKLMKQLQLFSKNESLGVVYSDVMVVGQAGEHTLFEATPRFRGNILPHLYGTNFIPFSSSVIRRDLLVAQGMFDESLGMGIDYDLWLRLSLVTQFDYIQEPLVAYRMGHGQMSRNWEGRVFWARVIDERFVERHPSLVSRQMVRHCEWERTYVRYRQYEKTRPALAFLAVVRMLMLRPLNKTACRSLGRLLWVQWQALRARLGFGKRETWGAALK